MKRKATLVILVLFQSLLFSCKQPKEEGGSSVVLEWGGSLETTTISYEEPLGGSYDANRTFKEKEPVNLYDLGLEQDLGELPPSYLIPWFCRNDGVLDPFFEKKPSDLSFGVTNQSEGFPEKRKDKLECFSPQSYLYITSTVWYAEVSFFEQGNYVCFYDFSLPQYNRSSAMNNPFMDAVYANGVWSYVVTFEYDPLEERPSFAAFQKGLDLLWGLLFCTLEDYPYSVYMDAHSLYFMSKDTAFPNDYIEEFNKREDMHLIYR